MSMNYSLRPSTLQHRQRGVNLIEIMVAMVIGLFLVLGATTLYINTKKTSDVDDAIARLQETARYAMSVIETDVRMANYWGLKKDGADFANRDSNLFVATSASALGASVSPNYCGAVYATNTMSYVAAENNGYGLPAACPANSAAVATSDTLTVRRASAAVAAAGSATRLQVCSSRTNFNNVVKDAAATCVNGELHNLITNGYYVDQQSDQSVTLPSLRRKTLIDGPAFRDDEIIPGVEDMQIELGWDNSSEDNAGVVRYVQPGDAVLTDAAGLPAGRVVSVRIWLLIRAEQPDFTFTDTRTYTYGDRPAYTPADNFRRLLVSRTFFVRNVTGT
jgi:type IV pilus assembly protein PilW